MGTHTFATARGSALARPDGSTRDVLDGLRHIVRTLREASRDAERTVGISAAQLFVLQRLAGGLALSVSELAARTLTHQSSVSVVVAKLARRGLVARVRASSDARRLEVSLTPAGSKLLERAPAATQDRLIAALALMGRAARARLANDLQVLLDAMGVERGDAPMLFEAPAVRTTHATRTKGSRRVRSLT
jgi:DNA-binding MarR family transcriptional regulator